MGVEGWNSRRKFLSGVAALPLFGAHLQERERQVPLPAAGKLTLAFSGMCAFVPKDGHVVVVFPDTTKPGKYERPIHRAALAHVRMKGGEFVETPTIVALDDVEIALRGTTPDEQATIKLDASGLVPMIKAAGGAEYGAIHKDCIEKRRRIQARIVIDPKVIGSSLNSAPAGGLTDETLVKEGEEDDDQCGVPVKVAPELRFAMNLASSSTVKLWARRHGQADWASWFIASEPSDDAAFVFFMNLAVDNPNPGLTMHDHHFLKYYDLCRKQPSVRRLPALKWDAAEYAEGLLKTPKKTLGGGIPRCAMALFEG